MTPAEQARKDVEEWARDWDRTLVGSRALEVMIAGLMPVYERAQQAERWMNDAENANYAIGEADALRERAERLEKAVLRVLRDCDAAEDYPTPSDRIPRWHSIRLLREALAESASPTKEPTPCYCGVHPPHKDSRCCVPDNTATKTERKP